MGIKRYLSGLTNEPVRRSLTNSVLDGIMWSAMYGLAENYITPFALLFGASLFEVSLLQGFGQLATGSGQLIGAALIQKGKATRKKLCITTVIVHAATWLGAFWLTLLIGNPAIAILFYCMGIFSNNVGSPGWNSWMNDLVPENERGVFWSLRNRTLGIVQFATISAAGLFLYWLHGRGQDHLAYGILFTIAFLSRMGCVRFLSRQHESPFEHSDQGARMNLVEFIRDLPSSVFGRFVIFTVLINFTVVMINPIIQVYLLESLKLNYIEYTAVTMTATIAAFIFMTYWGSLSDRFGNRRILIVTAAALPFTALSWLFVHSLWALILIQMLSGFVTSGFNLATTNYIFDATAKPKLPKTVAYFNTLFTTAGFLGSLFSGFIADRLRSIGWHWWILDAFLAIFAIAALLRFLVIAFFARKIREVREIEPNPGLSFFYLYKPFQEITSVLYRVNRKIRRELKR